MPKGYPTYQRIDPITGRVTNEFEGSIVADGITLPVGAGDADPEDSHRVQWERRADGVMIAQAYTAETGPGGKGVTFKRDYAYTDVVGGEAHSTFATRAPGPSGGAGYSSEVHIATGNPGGTPSNVNANAWTPTKGSSVNIIDSNGDSSFSFKDLARYGRIAGPFGPKHISFNIAKAGTYLLTWVASGYCGSVGFAFFDTYVDGAYTGQSPRFYFNVTNVHLTAMFFRFGVGLTAGNHSMGIGNGFLMASDDGDFCDMACQPINI